MDNRDEITKEYFDEKTIEVIDNTGGQFLDWFGGDNLRVARLSGAPAHSKLTIEHVEEGGFHLMATGIYLKEGMHRLVLQKKEDSFPSLFILNSSFVLPPELRGKKLGARSVAIEVFEAKVSGQFAHVDVHAIGNSDTLNPEDSENQYSGYLVWPQLGFDGPIPESLKEAHVELSAFQNISSLLAHPDGKKIWAMYGGDIKLQFDLTEGSPSWVALNAYLDYNGIKVKP